MPRSSIGQQITFAVEFDADDPPPAHVWMRARKGDTIAKIAGRRGHPEWKQQILKLNKGRDVLPHPKRKPGHKRPPVPKLRNVKQVLRTHASIRLPGQLKKGTYLSALAGDKAPHITAGYAKYDVIDIPGRVGLNRFDGYDPIAMDIPIQFEAYSSQQGATIETNITELERMAGRGKYPGSHVGPPAVVRVSVTDNHGDVVPLIPHNYQWSPKNQTAPLWRISQIAWDDSPERNVNGFRVRQAAVVTVTQYTPLLFIERSVAKRSKQKHKPHPKDPKDKARRH